MGDGSGLTGVAGGSVESVTASYPVASSGGTDPNITVDLSLYAKLASPTFTGTVSGIDKTMVGLGNVANTAQVTSVTGTSPIASSGGTTPAISISATPTFTTVTAASMSITGTAERWAGNTYPANLIDFNDSATAVTIEPGIISPRVTPTAGTTITATGNLTIAQIGAASFFPVDTTGGAITLTLYSDAIDNGIPATDVGRLIRIAVVAGGTNAVTLALDANLTFVAIDGTEAVEDAGDYIECHIITTDIVSCVAIEAD